MRAVGVKINRKSDKALVKVYSRWNKGKETYKIFKDSTGGTRKGSSANRHFMRKCKN
jgi:hypothetical protein